MKTRPSLLLMALVAACARDTGPTAARFVSVSAGYNHSCAVMNTGAAACWGENRLGALGDGQRDTNSLVPVPVAGGLALALVSAGGVDSGHTCGVTTGGDGYCWGNAAFGRLGDGSSSVGGAVQPQLVAGGLHLMGVSAGYDGTCGIAAGGGLWCWGDGTFGELGTGAFNVYALAPTAVGGSLVATAVSAGGQQVCAIAAGGAAYCWGSNGYGALGIGPVTGTAVPAAVSGGLSFMTISTGRNHTCAVTTDSAGYCWGYGNYGRLGNDTTLQSNVPVAVAGGLHFAVIRAGGYHSCGLTGAGRLYCWGYNESGQIGDGTTTERHAPVPVASALTFASFATGWRHTCAVTTAGAVYCWGLNDHGQLGVGDTTSRAVPVRSRTPTS